jgi:hypothetical protein
MNNPAAQGDRDRGRPILHFEFLEDALHVAVRRLLGDAEVGADFLLRTVATV